VGIRDSANDRITVTLQNSTATALAAPAAINTAAIAQAAITTLDTAIDSNNSARAAYGSAQNTLTSALHNLESYSENLVAAESRIRDVDFASETADMTRNSIFQQAGVSVLAQANTSPQVALQLLQ
jgi:flagellin